jgi:hypothetical protein
VILSTDIWVAALIRRAELGGGFGVVAHKGDARAGSVLVKAFNQNDGTVRVFSEATKGDGSRVWMQPLSATDEPSADAYLTRCLRVDPDLWVVEIEDREGRHFLVEPVDST